MSNYKVFVKEGDVKDFDDIYEGMIPEVIASVEEVKNFCSTEFLLDEWNVVENRKLVGKIKNGYIEVTIDAVGSKNARMINTSGLNKNQLSQLISKFGLSELE